MSDVANVFTGTISCKAEKYADSIKFRSDNIMKEFILYALLLIITACSIAILYYIFKSSKKNDDNVHVADEPPVEPFEIAKKIIISPDSIPHDVVFDDRNLPVRTTRSKKRKVNYGKDFNAYLVKGGTIYHKKSCKKLAGKKVVTKHVYECIADKNKKPCPYCKPRTEIHEWYIAKFPDSIYVKEYLKDSYDVLS